MLELFADRARALAVVDPDDRELVISCGAALGTMRVAARAAGVDLAIRLLPDGPEADLLARVWIAGAHAGTARDKAMGEVIPLRHTSRQVFEARQLPAALLRDLALAAAGEGVQFTIAGDTGRPAVVKLIMEGDRTQFADPAFRRELAAWMRPGWPVRPDGIPGYALGYNEIMSLPGPFAVRTFDMGDARAARDEELALGSPVLAVLSTPADTPGDWLAAGMALARVLLHARAEEVSASFLNQPVEVPELRPALAMTLGIEGFPQLVLRLGYGPPAPPSPRRPLAEVLFIATTTARTPSH